MTKLEQHREVWPNKSDEWLFERLANELKDKVETIHKLLTENEQLRTAAVSKRLFLCDICRQEKSGKKFPVLDENWNKQSGLNQCEDCFKEGCGID